MANKSSKPNVLRQGPLSADDARRQLLRQQGRWFRDANINYWLPTAGAATLSGAAKAAPQIGKVGLARAVGGAALAEMAVPFAPLIYGGSMLWDYANNYDHRAHNRLASQSFSRRGGMYNPYDD